MAPSRLLTRADVVAKASVRSSKVSIRRGNLGWQGHEPQMRRARSSSVLAGAAWVLSASAEAFGLLHHQRLSARAVHVVVPQDVSEHMSSFITTSMELLSPTVAWRLGIPKQLEHARPGCFGAAGLDSLGTGSIADELAGSKDRRLDLAATPRARRPTLAHKINCVRSVPPRVENSGARCNTRVARLGPACLAAAVPARCWPSATTRPRSPRWRCLRRGDCPLMGAGDFE